MTEAVAATADPPLHTPRWSFSDGATGYWRLDETSGTTARNSASGGRDGRYVGKNVLDRPGKSLDDRAVALDGDPRIRCDSVAASVSRPHAMVGRSVGRPPRTGAQTRRHCVSHTRLALELAPVVLGYGSFDGTFSDGRHAWVGFYSSNGFYRELLGMWSHIGDITGTWSRQPIRASCRSRRGPISSGPTTRNDDSALQERRNHRKLGGGGRETAGRGKRAALYIGSRWWLDSRQFFSGTISDVALYPTALTPTQVRQHYRAVKDC